MELSTMITICGVEGHYESVQLAAMLDKAELLAELDARGITNSQMMKVLGIPSSRVSEIMWAAPGRQPPVGKKARQLTYDEGVKLVRAFGLEQTHRASPLPASVLRLAVRHIGLQLQAPATEAQIEELAEDLRAFSEYASDPKVRRSVEAAEGFFQALQLRRPANDTEVPQETDPETDSETNH